MNTPWRSHSNDWFADPRFTVLDPLLEDMPRTPTVTADGAVEAIREAETPFASTGQLAGHFDVTRQAIRDQRDRLATDPRIEIGSISNNTVFYLADSEGANPGNMTNDDVIEQSGQVMRDMLDEQGETEHDHDGGEDVSRTPETRDVETAPETTTNLIERLARRRMVLFGALFLGLGLVFLPIGVSMIAGGAALPGGVMLALAFLTLLGGAGLVGVAAVAQLALARPLRGLVVNVDEVEHD